MLNFGPRYFAVLCCMLGSTMVAFRAEARHRDVTAFGIVVNLLLPVRSVYF